MARTRLVNNPKPQKRGVMSVVGWEQLLRKAILRAEKAQDRRLEGLKKALQDRRSELLLRKMGVICEADLDREFPIEE
jgi:hypothetical protein